VKVLEAEVGALLSLPNQIRVGAARAREQAGIGCMQALLSGEKVRWITVASHIFVLKITTGATTYSDLGLAKGFCHFFGSLRFFILSGSISSAENP
jgi:hypothetical protein